MDHTPPHMNVKNICDDDSSNLPAVLPPDAAPPRPAPLLPERSDFLEGDAPAADKVQAFLARALEATGSDAPTTAGALVPWICDALLSNHSVKAYGRDLMDFLRHMQAQGVTPLEVTADHVKLYKRALLEASRTSATVARRLSVIRGAYKELAAKGLVPWETAQDIGAVKAPGVQKNSTPSLTQRQAISMLEAIPTDTLQGMRDLALMSVFFLTGCRVSAVVGACVGHLETDGVEHYLHVTEKRDKKRRKILLDAARPVLRLPRAGGYRRRQGGALVPAHEARRHRAGAAAPGQKDPLAAREEILQGGRHRPAAAGRPGVSAFTRCARPPSTTRSEMERRCTRCASSPATRISGRPRSTSCGKRKMRRWRHGASTFASRDARASKPVVWSNQNPNPLSFSFVLLLGYPR